MSDSLADVQAFVQWFEANEGFVDTKVMGITEFPGSGRGAIALCDILEGHTLFTLPRTITLSTRTSPLPALFGLDAWRAHRLHKGWVGLILCMMWEDAWAHEPDVTEGGHGYQAKWGPYMHTLPATFDTPMFWSAEELRELQGTCVLDKIGRDDAERAYFEQLIPAITKSPTLFPPSHHRKWYTLDAYHCAGSRILSRSFTVSHWIDDKLEERDGAMEESDAEDVEDPYPDTSVESSMNFDAHIQSSPLDNISEKLDSDSQDDEQDDPSDVAMVPMADLLNAKWGSENAKLFYEPLILRMVATKSIAQGEQIFNTYGDPPNSDLLRRYGHVDLVRLQPSSCATPGNTEDVEMIDGDTDVESVLLLGNPSDVAEIRADLVVHAIQTANSEPKSKDVHARIEWWLDEGEEDAFVLTLPESGSQLSAIIPSALLSLTRLLTLSEADFKSAREGGKLPKGKLRAGDIKENSRVLEILDNVFKQREEMYAGGSLEDDKRLLSLPEPLTTRKRHAVIVRLGEKRILRAVRQALRTALAELSGTSGGVCGNEKDGTRVKESGQGGKEASSRKRVTNGTEGGHRWKKARK